MARWKIAGINFEHFHMGDNLRLAAALPDVEIVGLCDEQPDRMRQAIGELQLPSEKVFTDWQACLDQTQPDIVLLCPAAAGHGLWTERVMAHGVDVLIEKPMAASLAEADSMIAAAQRAGRTLAINWPMTWFPTHRTAHRLIREGTIGDVIEVHYYDGNRGPLHHAAGKQQRTAEQIAADKPNSWFYQKAAGGGALLDYLGYGATLATWFNGGQRPIEVTAVVDQPAGLEVDEHCVAVLRYATGLSKLETRWGTFTDPWTHQPQPRCGFVIVGTEGTIGCFDYQPTVRLQTREEPAGVEIPVDAQSLIDSNPVAYLIHCLENRLPIEGPLSPETSRIGQQIVDTAIASAAAKQTLPLLD
ncbi:Gfo/Idh/MocA family protein [Rosistilla oblonga]|uniref:Gfo/Idh/MocA family protein n=1 Tax=Rosistilla oblonga TaxID=2527990 RepID=UPI003A98582C